MDTGLVLAGDGSGTKRTNAIRVHRFPSAVYQRVARMSVRVGVGGRTWVGIANVARVAVAVRIGHSAGEGGGGLAVGAGGGIAPSSVSTLILGHLRLHANSR